MAERAGARGGEGGLLSGVAGTPLLLVALAAAAAAFVAAPAGLALAGAAEPWAGAGVLVALILIVTGLHLVVGVGGLPCLGQAGFAALGALATAQAAVRLGLPVPLALPLGGIASALAGALAAPVLCRLPAPAFAGATLALGALLALPAANAPGLFAPPGPAAGGPVGYITAAALALVALLAAWRLTESEVGAALRVAGDDPRTAAATGIDAPRLRRRVFVLGVALAGLGGGALVQARGAAGALDAGASLVLFAAVLLGGPGRLIGALMLGVPFGLFATAMLAAPQVIASDPRLPLAGLAALIGLVLWRRRGPDGAGDGGGPGEGEADE